ncbi:class I SAM-dependent methyltransferase [Pseudomonas nitroreducens]|uniref:SAM-dependent methyltransferase n=1 Tax=Pseudomonas nitroreducens TaxID=46680 RepID=A0A246F5Y0_PSENT|nr:class I SAM-dependent methyltransferase [Pseudomonas nitroreducens]OWP48627.1 SAM-dependent methyltransferase [Pseudomonas nitroreducens]
MFSRLKRALQAPTVAPADPARNGEPESAAVLPELGLIDMSLSGWFRNETGELIEGFPISTEDSVLDIGCGDGGFTTFAGRQGAEIFVADISQDNVSKAVLRVKETIARAVHPLVTDADPIPLPDGRVSRVIAMEVLEHVDDPAKFMAELTRIAQPGALFLLTVPDAASEHAQKGLAPQSYYRKPNHIRIFEREEFDQLVADAGLIIERRLHYGFYRTIWWMLYWAVEHADLATADSHPMIEKWRDTWGAILSMPKGKQIKRALDEVLPKSQVIIARKP